MSKEIEVCPLWEFVDKDLQQQIQTLQKEGLWVSGVCFNDYENILKIIKQDNSPTKWVLFHALYEGPVWLQPIQRIINIFRILRKIRTSIERSNITWVTRR